MLIICKTSSFFFELILLLKLKKVENITCFIWKSPILSDLEVNKRTEQHIVAAVCLKF
jgi:hypothetical protein